ncbi:hypothetical protein ZWY2020_046074 [Hordeum vulgare]|nr:hypothetical protein ZWY2020_046074 [Hordeum vulgare]
MAFVQRRKGPHVVGSFRLLQPLADGLKLILKEPISPSSANFSLFRMAPVATFMLSLVAWALYLLIMVWYCRSNIGLLYLFAISSLGVYGIIIAGWSSKRGGARRLGLINPFFHSSRVGHFSGRDREVEVIKRDVSLAPHIKRKGSLSSWSHYWKF